MNNTKKIYEDLKRMVAEKNIEVIIPATQPRPLGRTSRIESCHDMILIDYFDVLRVPK